MTLPIGMCHVCEEGVLSLFQYGGRIGKKYYQCNHCLSICADVLSSQLADSRGTVYGNPSPEVLDNELLKYDGLAKFIWEKSGCGETVFDFGCGRGMLALALCKYFARVIAHDVNPTLISELVKTHSAPPQLKVLNPHEVDNKTVDIIVCWHVLEHIVRPTQIIFPLLDKLRPGGVFCCQVPLFDRRYLDDDHVVFWTEYSIKKIFGGKFEKLTFGYDLQRNFMTFLGTSFD